MPRPSPLVAACVLLAAPLSPGCLRLFGHQGGDAEGGGDADLDAAGDVDDDVGPPTTWVTVRAGTFLMGSPPGELGREDRETQHEVTLTRSFEIQATEVTAAEYDALMGTQVANESGCPRCPITTIRWDHAAAYCNALSAAAAFATCYSCAGDYTSMICALASSFATPYDCPGYRLPTEAEWEYAARAGTTTATYASDLDDTVCSSAVLDPIAWYCGNWGDELREVGLLEPNAWGLHDMLGNVFEWTHDGVDVVTWTEVTSDYPAGPAVDPWAHELPGVPERQLVRGGSRFNTARYSRAAFRDIAEMGLGTELGFRPVRSLP